MFVGGMDLCMSVCGVHLHVVAFGRHSFVLHSATKVTFLKLSVLLRACNGALSPLGSPCGLHDQPQAPPLFSYTQKANCIKGENNPNIHQQMNRLTKCGTYIQWNIIQP